MSWKFFRSINIGPIRINFSKSGIGWSIGGRGFRIGTDSKGKKYNNISIPGTGISKKTYIDSNSNNGTNNTVKKSNNFIFVIIIFAIAFLIKSLLK
jgi:hypothetical protein